MHCMDYCVVVMVTNHPTNLNFTIMHDGSVKLRHILYHHSYVWYVLPCYHHNYTKCPWFGDIRLKLGLCTRFILRHVRHI